MIEPETSDYAPGEVLEQGVTFNAEDIYRAYVAGAAGVIYAGIDLGLSVDAETTARAADAYVKLVHLERGKASPNPLPKENRPMPDTRIFYGPHECSDCGKVIVRASMQEGGEKYDQPDGPIYPSTVWQRHNCDASKITATPLPMPHP